MQTFSVYHIIDAEERVIHIGYFREPEYSAQMKNILAKHPGSRVVIILSGIKNHVTAGKKAIAAKAAVHIFTPNTVASPEEPAHPSHRVWPAPKVRRFRANIA